MDISCEVVWENNQPKVRTIHLENVNMDTLSADIRKVSSKLLKAEIFRTKLAHFKRQNPIHPRTQEGQFEGRWYLKKPIDAVLNYPELLPQDAIVQECCVTVQTARNYLNSMKYTMEYYERMEA
jgi:hypothetical protein